MGGNFEFAASNSKSDFQNVVPFLPTICPTRSSDLASPKSQRPQSNANDHLRQGRTTTSWTLIVDLLRRRPNSIETRVNGTGVEWYLWNQTIGENFYGSWNKHPERARAFFEWHGKLVADVEHLTAAEGLDNVRSLLRDVVGRSPANAALDALTTRVSAARTGNRLSVNKSVGLILGTALGATPVRGSTFFGDSR